MFRHIKLLRALLVSTTLLACLPAAQVEAQSEPAADSSNALEEIVVTAEHRQASIQQVPLAVTAISGAELADRKINDIQDLTRFLPSVDINPTLGIGRITIRGIGLDTTAAGNDSRVAFNVDGVYISRPSAILGTMFDVSRVEVLRGPQGTLYGRNATAGAINLITNDPDPQLGGYVNATLGNYFDRQVQAALSVPMGSDTGLRISGQLTDRDGYGKDLTTGTDVNDANTRSARAVFVHHFNDDIRLRLTADYHHEDDADYAFQYLGQGNPRVVPTAIRLGGLPPPNPWDTYANTPQANNRTFSGYSGTFDWDLHFANLTSVTGYRDSNTAFVADADGTNIQISNNEQFEKAHQFSQELRLANDFSRGSWLVGAYYFDEHINGYNRFAPLSLAISGGPVGTLRAGFESGQILDSRSKAAFGEFRFRPLEKLTLILGGRETEDSRRSHAFTVTDLTDPPTPDRLTPSATAEMEKSWNNFSKRFSAEYRPTEDVMLYATYAEGFQAGNFSGLTTTGRPVPPVNPEYVKDYEAGLKADWLDRRLRTNVAAFHYNYSDLQVAVIAPGGLQLVNAAAAKVDGVEFEATARPLPHFETNLTADWLHARYTNFVTADPARPGQGNTVNPLTGALAFNLAGNTMPQAPAFTLNAGAQYGFDAAVGVFTLRGEAAWSSKVQFSPFNRDILAQDAYAMFNGFLNYVSPQNNWNAGLYVKNLTDKAVTSYRYVTNPLFGSPVIGSYYPPRTYGLQVGYKF